MVGTSTWSLGLDYNPDSVGAITTTGGRSVSASTNNSLPGHRLATYPRGLLPVEEEPEARVEEHNHRDQGRPSSKQGDREKKSASDQNSEIIGLHLGMYLLCALNPTR